MQKRTRIIIVGNSSSGKSTLAKQLSKQHKIVHLDLDTVAWHPTTPPTRCSIESSIAAIDKFIGANTNWVIEGCYGDIFQAIMTKADSLIFMDLSVSQCLENAKQRPFEAHKYSSKEAQDKNLTPLLSWIADYPTREDWSGRVYHEQLFNNCRFAKQRITHNNSLKALTGLAE